MSRVNRIYHQALFSPGCELILTGESHHYLSRVLRIKSGETVQLFNHEGREFLCKFVSADRKSSTFICQRELTPVAEPPIGTQLELAICKADRMDFALQKATELGITTVQPLMTAHNTHNRIRLEHLRGVIRSACEQCGRVYLPEIRQPIQVEEMQPVLDNEQAFVLDTEAVGSPLRLAQPSKELKRVRFAIGPEGGWHADEVVKLNALGYQSTHLGQRILRNETAVVATLSIIQHQLRQLG